MTPFWYVLSITYQTYANTQKWNWGHPTTYTLECMLCAYKEVSALLDCPYLLDIGRARELGEVHEEIKQLVPCYFNVANEAMNSIHKSLHKITVVSNYKLNSNEVPILTVTYCGYMLAAVIFQSGAAKLPLLALMEASILISPLSDLSSLFIDFSWSSFSFFAKCVLAFF